MVPAGRSVFSMCAILGLLAVVAWWTVSLGGARGPGAHPGQAIALAPVPAASAAEGALAPPATEPVEADPPRSFEEAMRRGDRAAGNSQYRRALLDWKRAYEFYLADLRGLTFRTPVGCDFMRRSALRDFVRTEINREMPPEKMEALRKQLIALGLAGTDFDPAQLLPEIFTQEVAGFYDPRTRLMRLISEIEDGAPAPKTKLGRLVNSFQFSPEEQKAILLHEMDHALVDQWWDLDGLYHAALDDDDAAMAITSLVEGEATVVMMAPLTGENQSVVAMSPDSMKAMSKLAGPLMETAGGPALKKAPPIIAVSLVFPYLQGGAFVLALTNSDKSWRRINDAYTRPPRSTEHILHPEKFLAAIDPPLTTDLGEVAAAAGAAWTVAAQNSVGEMALEVLVRGRLKQPAEEIAAGWGGDVYAVLEHTDGALALVLRTTWDDEDEASEFARAWIEMQKRRCGGDAGGGSEPAAAGEVDVTPGRFVSELRLQADATTRQGMHEGSALYLELRGRDVLVIEGLDAGVLQSVSRVAFGAGWLEKQFPFPPPREK